MNLILVTGLDGSGKSTLLGQLENKTGFRVAVLRVPKLDADRYRHHPLLEQAAGLINRSGELSDILHDRNLKTASIFWAMLFFGDFLEELCRIHPGDVVCERHPLLDTVVYGKAYYPALDPDAEVPPVTGRLLAGYSRILQHMDEKLAHLAGAGTGDRYRDLLRFLKDRFSTERSFTKEALLELFPVPLPDKVYFLDALPETLMRRIGDRSTHEYHETLENLRAMRTIYKEILSSWGHPVHIVDTEQPGAMAKILDELAGRPG